MKKAFTLIELLVVIAIIAILAAILFPVFAQAKTAAKKTTSLSNLKQIGYGLTLYVMDNEAYPQMSCPSSWSPAVKWVDRIYMYVKSEEIFCAPAAGPEMFTRKFAHNPNKLYGGYGYNYQYLGNARENIPDAPRLPFTVADTSIMSPAETIAMSDTSGVRMDDNRTRAGNYVIDPPIGSKQRSGKDQGYYGDPNSGTPECGTQGLAGPGYWGCRSVPAERHNGYVALTFADGHAKTFKLKRIDDFDGNGQLDNGWWNGKGDANATD